MLIMKKSVVRIVDLDLSTPLGIPSGQTVKPIVPLP